MEPLRTVLQAGLSSFVHSGTPNARAKTFWPAYTIASDRHLALKATPSVGSGLARAACDFWDQIALLSQVFM